MCAPMRNNTEETFPMYEIFLVFIRRCGFNGHGEYSRKLGNAECVHIPSYEVKWP